MAATRLIALHVNKGRSSASTLKDRLDYSQNHDKTDDGRLISAYQCDPETAWQEFDLSLKEYTRLVGREGQTKVIAYQIRQSFKPGEITPEEANRIGYETAMRFTKGKHAFTVSTHTDRPHIHNHINFCSVSLDSTKRWRNFFLSAYALQNLSDLVCAENGYSVIIPKPRRDRTHRTVYPRRLSRRDEIRETLRDILSENPRSMEEVVRKMQTAGYECRQGKYVSVRKTGEKNFIRLRSLGEGFTENDLDAIFNGQAPPVYPKMDFLIDIEKKMQEGKGAGYEKWAESFNNRQQAKVLLFLQDNGISSEEELTERTEKAAALFHSLSSGIKEKEARLREISEMKTQIYNYSKTRKTYEAYRKAGYSKQFLTDHREEIETHRAAKAAFSKYPGKKLPTVKDLSAEYDRILTEIKADRTAYREAKKEMEAYVKAKENVRMILHPKRFEETRSLLR